MESTQDPSDQLSSSSLSNGCVGFELHISVHSFFSLSPSPPYSLKLFYMILSPTILHIYFNDLDLILSFLIFFSSFSPPPVLLFSSCIFSNFFFFSFQLPFLATIRLLFCLFAFLSPLNQSVGLLNFECVSSVDVVAISAAEDEAAEGGVS